MRRLSLTLAAALYATQATAGLSFRTDAPEPVDHQYWKFLVRSVAKAADAKPPQDIVAMLEQVAVVEEMEKVCSHARPDLSDRLAKARDDWWEHNDRVLSAFAELVRTKDTSPVSKTLLGHFRAVQRKLDSEFSSAAQSGENCDWVLWEMRTGHLDYPNPPTLARPRSRTK
ncbi:MAG TPA: hypothetical protein VGM05_29075 [Planctomycetaceae bacterium]|jgi:hypothetical protein